MQRNRRSMGRAREFDIDTFELPFGVHLPPYSESDPCKELNPPLYENLYPQPKLEDRRSIDIRQIGLCHNVQTVNQHSERYNYSQRYSGDMPDRYSITVDVVWIWHRSFLPVGVHMLLVSPKTSFYYYETETIAAHAHQKSAPFLPPEINRSRFRSWRKKMCVVTEKVKILESSEFYPWFYCTGSRMVLCFNGELIYFTLTESLPCCSQTELFTSGMYFIYICMCCITFQCAKESKGLWIYNDFCLIISSWKLFYKSNAKVNTDYLIIICTLGWFTDIEQIYGQYKN